MRKLIVSMNITLDAYLSGPSCELDWHFGSWTSDMAETLAIQLSRADTMLLGSTTYKAMAAYWPAKLQDPSCPREDMAFIEMMNNYRKVVASRRGIVPTWGNTEVLNGDLFAAITDLKAKEGKEIMLYGSGKLVSELVRLGLVDEYQLWLHPTALGRGKTLFGQILHPVKLKPISTETFRSGVVMLAFECDHSSASTLIE